MAKQDGSTLVEVVISLLLTCVMVSAVFSVILSAKESGSKADRKILGGEAVASLRDALKAYGTDNASCFAPPNAACATFTINTIKGPNYLARCTAPNYLCQAGWNIHTPGIQEDRACTINAGPNPPWGTNRPGGFPYTTVQDNYALTPGDHCLVCNAPATGGQDTSCFLPKILRDPPYNGVIFYTVTAGNPPQVQVGVYWDEP